jgi:UPF0271 protein
MRRPARRELGASRSAQRAREGFGSRRLGDDDALLDIVTSANVACGFHAGDPDALRRVWARAAERDVAIGAQVSYRDLVGFGRRAIDVPAATLINEVIYEVGALDAFARIAGTRVRYVKPHGALYKRIVHDEVQACGCQKVGPCYATS